MLAVRSGRHDKLRTRRSGRLLLSTVAPCLAPRRQLPLLVGRQVRPASAPRAGALEHQPLDAAGYDSLAKGIDEPRRDQIKGCLLGPVPFVGCARDILYGNDWWSLDPGEAMSMSSRSPTHPIGRSNSVICGFARWIGQPTRPASTMQDLTSIPTAAPASSSRTRIPEPRIGSIPGAIPKAGSSTDISGRRRSPRRASRSFPSTASARSCPPRRRTMVRNSGFRPSRFAIDIFNGTNPPPENLL